MTRDMADFNYVLETLFDCKLKALNVEREITNLQIDMISTDFVIMVHAVQNSQIPDQLKMQTKILRHGLLEIGCKAATDSYLSE